MSLSLSVVVCTHSRPDDLTRCLDALCRLDEPSEIIVVDSASKPPVRELVTRYALRLSHVRYVRKRSGVVVEEGDDVATRLRDTRVARAREPGSLLPEVTHV